MVDLGGGLANERSERSFFLAIERISGIKSDKKIFGVTPHFLRSKILNNHQLGMNNQPIIIKILNNLTFEETKCPIHINHHEIVIQPVNNLQNVE